MKLIELWWRFWKVKPGWRLDPLHDVCCTCGAEAEVPTAYNDAGEWYLSWYCDVCGGTPLDNDHLIEWPMRRNWATPEDLKRLGFYIF